MAEEYIIEILLKARDEMSAAFARATAEMETLQAVQKEITRETERNTEANKAYTKEVKERTATDERLAEALKREKVGSVEHLQLLEKLKQAHRDVAKAEAEHDTPARIKALSDVAVAHKALIDQIKEETNINKGLAVIQANRAARNAENLARETAASKVAQKSAEDAEKARQKLIDTTLKGLKEQGKEEAVMSAARLRQAKLDIAQFKEGEKTKDNAAKAEVVRSNAAANARLALAKRDIAQFKSFEKEKADAAKAEVTRENEASKARLGRAKLDITQFNRIEKERADAVRAAQKAQEQEEELFQRKMIAARGPAQTLARTDISQRQEIEATRALIALRQELARKGVDLQVVDQGIKQVREDALVAMGHETQASRDLARVTRDEAEAYHMVEEATRRVKASRASGGGGGAPIRGSGFGGPNQPSAEAIAGGGGIFQGISSAASGVSGAFDFITTKVVALSALIGPFSALLVGLIGTLGALASAALAAGAAVGVTFLAGIAQGIPALGIFAAAMQRLQNVFGLVSAGLQQQQQRFIAHFETAAQNAMGINQVAIAQHGLSDAMFQAGLATQNVTFAQHSYSDALYSLTIAQKNVAVSELNLKETRQAATRQLQDLITQETNARLAAEASSLAITHSQRALRQAIATGGDVQGAQLQLAQAQAGHAQAVTQAQRAIADAAPGSLARQGIQEQVTQSAQAVEGAQRAVVDADYALKQAATGIVQAQRAVVDAQFQVAQARAAVIQAQQAAAGYNIGTAAQMAWLRSQMTKTELALTDSISKILGLFRGANAYMKPLTDAILGPFLGLSNQIYKLLKDPQIFGALKTLADAMGKGLGTIIKTVFDRKSVSAFATIIKAAAGNVGPIARIISDLFKGIQAVVVAAGPFVADLFKYMAGVADQFVRFTTSKEGKKWLKEFFTDGFAALKAFMGLGVALINLFLTIAGPGGGAKAGTDLINGLATALNNLTDDLNNRHSPAFKTLQSIWKSIGPVLSALGTIFGAIFTALLQLGTDQRGQNTLKNLAHFVADVLVPAFVTFATDLGVVVGVITDFVNKHPQFSKILGEVLAIGGVLVVAFKGVGLLFKPISLGLGVLRDASRLFGSIAGFVGKLIGVDLSKLFGRARGPAASISAALEEGGTSVARKIREAFAGEGGSGGGKGIGNAVRIIAPIHEAAQAVRVWVVNGGGLPTGKGTPHEGGTKGKGGVGGEGALTKEEQAIEDAAKGGKFSGFIKKIPIVGNIMDKLGPFASKLGPIAGKLGTLGLALSAVLPFIDGKGGLKQHVIDTAKALDPSGWIQSMASLGTNIPIVGGIFKAIASIPSLTKLAEQAGTLTPAPYQTPAAKDVRHAFYFDPKTHTFIPRRVDPVGGTSAEARTSPPSSAFPTAGHGRGPKPTGSIFDRSLTQHGDASDPNFLANILRIPIAAGVTALQSSLGVGQSIHAGVKQGVKGIPRTISDSFQGGIDDTKRLLQIKSPSKVTEEIGIEIVNGVRNGIKGLSSIGQSLVESILRGAQEHWKDIQSIGAALDNWLRPGIEWRGFWGIGKDIVHSILVGAQNDWREISSIGAHLGDWLAAGFGDSQTKVEKLWADMWDSIAKTTTTVTGNLTNTLNDWWKNTNQTAQDQLNTLLFNFDYVYKAVDTDSFQAFWYILHIAQQALDAFGQKFKPPHLAATPKMTKSATGGFIGNMGERGSDRVHALLGRGEAVLNYAQQAVVDPALNAYYGFGLDKMFSRTGAQHAGGGARGYAAGGKIPGGTYPVNLYGKPRPNPDVMALIGLMEHMFPGLQVTSTTGSSHNRLTTSGNVSDHFYGNAVDLASGDYGLMNRAAEWVKTSGLYRSIKQGIHNPNLAIERGVIQTPPGDYAGHTWTEHLNHIHLAIVQAIGKVYAGALSAVGGVGGGIWNAIRRRGVTGHGVLANLMRASIGKVTAAANAFGQNAAGQVGATGGVGAAGTVSGLSGALRNIVGQISKRLGWTSMIQDWFSLINSESNGTITDTNPSSGAYGIAQMLAPGGSPSNLGPNKAKYYQYGGNPNTMAGQLIGMANYIKQRYVTPAAAWAFHRANNYYAKGGFAGGAVPILAHAGEWVVNQAQQSKLAGWLGTSRQGLKGAMGFSGGPHSYAGGGEVLHPQVSFSPKTGALQDPLAVEASMSLGFVFQSTDIVLRAEKFLTKMIANLRKQGDKVNKSLKTYLDNMDNLFGDGGILTLAAQAVDDFASRQAVFTSLAANGIRRVVAITHRGGKTIRTITERLSRSSRNAETALQVAQDDLRRTQTIGDDLDHLHRQEVAALGSVRNQIEHFGKVTKANSNQYRRLIGLRRTITNQIVDTDSKIASNAQDIIDKQQTQFQAQLDQTLRGTGTIGGRAAQGAIGGDLHSVLGNFRKIGPQIVLGLAQAAQSIAQTLGDPSKLAVSDQAILQSQTAIRDDIQKKYNDAAKKAKTDKRWQKTADDLLGQLESATSGVVQAQAAALTDAINTEGTKISVQTSKFDIAGRIAQIAIAMGNAAGGISQQIDTSRQRSSFLGGEISTYQGLLDKATAEGNTSAVNDLTQKIADLQTQVKESDLQTQQLITSLRQVNVSILQTRTQATGGFLGSATSITQTLGQIAGTLNLPALIAIAHQTTQTIADEAKQALKNISDTLTDPNGPFGANTGQANTFLSGAQGAFSQGPAAFAAWLSANAGALGSFESTLPTDQLTLFQSLIQALTDNTVANVTNTQQLQTLNATTGQQQFTSSAWTQFRQAIFNGLGQLLPQYAMTVPSLDVGGTLMSSGLIMGHVGEQLIPAIVKKGVVGAATHQTNNFSIDHPVEVADPVLFGNQVAWRLAHDPNSR